MGFIAKINGHAYQYSYLLNRASTVSFGWRKRDKDHDVQIRSVSPFIITALSMGSSNHGLVKILTLFVESIPTRPRDVIPWELESGGDISQYWAHLSILMTPHR
jgi:hypothetical protein